MSDVLAAMTPEQLAQTPAAMPPPGVKPNLVNPTSNAPVLIWTSSILMAVMFLFVAVRFYAKIALRRKLTGDDWTTLAAVIGTCWYFAICIHAVTKAKFGTHMWDISVAHTLSDDFLIAAFFANWPTGLVWAFAKSSFFLMYLQIFGPLIWLRICVYFGFFLNWGFYTAVIIASIYYQVPDAGQTWQQGFMNERYTKSLNMTIPIAAGSLFLDVYIFIIPLIAVMQLQLSHKKKMGVVAVFATGFVACVASSLSIYFKHNLNAHQDDYTYWVLPVLIMALVEMCVGISCSCMPTAAGFLKGKSNGWKGWSTSVVTIMRNLLRSDKRTDTSENFEGSWQSRSPLAKKNRSNYIDIEMEGSSTRELKISDHN